jgi:predicted RNA-binding Zn-ribbon protein involved in translation (DUF1610 family)
MLSIATPMEFFHERYLGRPCCPKCGVLILAPEASRYEGNGRIGHVWQCDDCDYDFRTVVRIAS